MWNWSSPPKGNLKFDICRIFVFLYIQDRPGFSPTVCRCHNPPKIEIQDNTSNQAIPIFSVVFMSFHEFLRRYLVPSIGQKNTSILQLQLQPPCLQTAWGETSAKWILHHHSCEAENTLTNFWFIVHRPLKTLLFLAIWLGSFGDSAPLNLVIILVFFLLKNVTHYFSGSTFSPFWPSSFAYPQPKRKGKRLPGSRHCFFVDWFVSCYVLLDRKTLKHISFLQPTLAKEDPICDVFLFFQYCRWESPTLELTRAEKQKKTQRSERTWVKQSHRVGSLLWFWRGRL